MASRAHTHSRDENRVAGHGSLKDGLASTRPKAPGVAFGEIRGGEVSGSARTAAGGPAAVKEDAERDIERAAFHPVVVSAEMSLSVLQKSTQRRGALVRSAGLFSLQQSYPSGAAAQPRPSPLYIPMNLENLAAEPAEPVQSVGESPAVDFGEVDLSDVLGDW